jgi:hypothetical protein
MTRLPALGELETQSGICSASSTVEKLVTCHVSFIQRRLEPGQLLSLSPTLDQAGLEKSGFLSFPPT